MMSGNVVDLQWWAWQVDQDELIAVKNKFESYLCLLGHLVRLNQRKEAFFL